MYQLVIVMGIPPPKNPIRVGALGVVGTVGFSHSRA